MLIGHLGVGLALKKWDPSLHLCWLLVSVLLLDLLLWVFILIGIEGIHIPLNYEKLALSQWFGKIALEVPITRETIL
jgi:hypothetical protein